ncbi:MAG: 23S rRNA (adenine(2503)-C(2))-methyltransferase RlmN [Candidatus Lokiarchaeota archaeon]|nr:23S rRNA (adenine(2503)-C(2))-methyltransferase RlmN [Candidatus Harpocratesius repetitus]
MNGKIRYIYSLTISELENFIENTLHYPKYRTKQVFQWLYHEISSFDEMLNIPKKLRAQLAENFYFFKPEIKQTLKSADHTVKYLITLHDGASIETVKMEYHHGISACISTQVGCKMHCAFCASGKEGFFRNLTAGEMIQQILTIQEQTCQRVASVVLMGSGEPLDNFTEVVRFLNLVHEKDGLNLGYRHITLSTCGIIPKIYELADLEIPITLAISLHAPIDSIRNQIVPISKKYPINELIQACRDYIERTHRRITFEYSLISGINDSIKMAYKLSNLLSGMLCHVNLIPVNSASPLLDFPFKPPSLEKIEAFQQILTRNHIPNTIRRTLGDEIQAACGQLKCQFRKKS